jgi:hypothetical protein
MPVVIVLLTLWGISLVGLLAWFTYFASRTGVSLEGATMPNGQRYADWLKSKGSEDGENSGPLQPVVAGRGSAVAPVPPTSR